MNKSILSEEDFKEPNLYPQNTIDGSKPVKADLPDIIPNSIFVATPMMGSLKFGCVKSLLELQNLCMSKKIHVKFHMVQSSIVTQGRNMCVQAFLHTRYSHMLCIDSDIEFDSTSILMMLKADKEIVLTAVKQSGDALQYASTSLKKDKEVVKVAIKQSGTALQYADSSLKKDKDIFKTSEEIYKNFIKSENLKGRKLTKVSIYFQRIWEKETMPGTFFFEDVF